MCRVNIYNRSTVEQVYPRGAFDRDSRVNSEAKAVVRHGVRIISSPDANGDFDLARASHHVAEHNPESDVVFVFPHTWRGHDAWMLDPDYGKPREKGDALAAIRDEGDYYDAFVSRIIDNAKSAEFKPAIGFRESRLRGFRGG